MTSMQWWRCKHGAPFDPKWGVIAKLARTEPGKVWAVVTALYDRASQAQNRGDVAGAGLDEIAEGFGWPVEEVQRIYSGLKAKSVIIDNRIASWERHQPKRERPKDNSAERTRRYRERLKASAQMASHTVTGDAVTVTPDVTVRDGHVTVVTVVTENAPSQAPAKPQLTAINGGRCDATVTPCDAQRREDSYSYSSDSQRLIEPLLVCEERKPPLKPAQKQISSKVERGSRWTLDAVPEDWIAAAEAAHPTVDVRAEAVAFVNWWLSAPGAKGVKLNWKATFMGWIGRDAKRLKEKFNGKTNSRQPRTIDDNPRGNFAAIAERLRSERLEREGWGPFDA